MTNKEFAEQVSLNSQIKEVPFIDLPLQAYKARRNLFLFSILCFARFNNITFEDGFKISGNKLVNFEDALFDKVLLFITLYFLIYFFILGWNTFKKWQLRTTGFEDSLSNKASAVYAGTGVDPTVEQSTAWQNIDPRLNSIFRLLSNISEFNKLKTPQTTTGEVNKLIQRCEQLRKDIEKNRTDDRQRFVVFEKHFWKYLIKSYLSFFFLEYGGPLFFGLVAIISLTVHIAS